jgi:hypothetical protein
MRKSRMAQVTILVMLLFGMATTVSASSGKHFRAFLDGESEVPVVITNAHGKAFFKRVGDQLEYRVIVGQIDNVTQAHIHVQNPGAQTGPVVAWLYPDGPPAVEIPGTSNGMLANGNVTASDLVGPLSGGSLDDLFAAIEAGTAYVNVHTTANPPGEIRGTLHEH